MMPFACMSLHAICTLNTKKPYEALAKAAVFSAAYICIRRWNSGIFKILFFSHFWYICLFLCSFGYAIGTCLIQTLLPNQLNFIILYEAAASVHWTFGITQSYGERFLGTISIVPELSNRDSYQKTVLQWMKSKSLKLNRSLYNQVGCYRWTLPSYGIYGMELSCYPSFYFLSTWLLMLMIMDHFRATCKVCLDKKWIQIACQMPQSVRASKNGKTRLG